MSVGGDGKARRDVGGGRKQSGGGQGRCGVGITARGALAARCVGPMSRRPQATQWTWHAILKVSVTTGHGQTLARSDTTDGAREPRGTGTARRVPGGHVGGVAQGWGRRRAGGLPVPLSLR